MTSEGGIELYARRALWLQDILMAVLMGDEAIKLAPNSAQVPVLLARTKQNVFNVREQAEAQQAAAATAAAAAAGLPPPATAAPPATVAAMPSVGMPSQPQVTDIKSNLPAPDLKSRWNPLPYKLEGGQRY